ncbi:MAG: hypothetical protein M1828_003969 [Chrysothrix sp. TS-e1954]|nr:MAG: hypothetical protein M1828_003969 [Chrysothrix sp. TS-e1954]
MRLFGHRHDDFRLGFPRSDDKVIFQDPAVRRTKPMHLFACGANCFWHLCPEEAILSGVKADPLGAQDEPSATDSNEAQRTMRNSLPRLDNLRMKHNRKCDLIEFREILADLQIEDTRGEKAFDRLQVLFAGLGCTAVVVNRYTLFILGFNPFKQDGLHPRVFDLGHRPGFASSRVREPMRCAFGDANGLIGVIDPIGTVWTQHHNGVEYVMKPIRVQIGTVRPQLDFVAVNGAGRTVAIARPSKNAYGTHVMEFEVLGPTPQYVQRAQGSRNSPDPPNAHVMTGSFLRWYCDPDNPRQRPAADHVLTEGVKQLKANNTTFTLLTKNGTVYTWGDARYPICLGRAPSVTRPARRPGPVECLSGLKVVHIASGGWYSGAVTEAGDFYMWGASPKGLDLFGNVPDPSDPPERIRLFELSDNDSSTSHSSARYSPPDMRGLEKPSTSVSETFQGQTDKASDVSTGSRSATQLPEASQRHPDSEKMTPTSGILKPSSFKYTSPNVANSVADTKPRYGPIQASTCSEPEPRYGPIQSPAVSDTEVRRVRFQDPMPTPSGSDDSAFVDDSVHVVDLAIGAAHALALEKNGIVWVVGDNSHGQLGLGCEAPDKHYTTWTMNDMFFMDGLSRFGIEGMAHRVHAGDYTSFVVVGPRDEFRNDPDFGEV